MNNNLNFAILDKTISGKINYYAHLSEAGKAKFCNRVAELLNEKEFEGMDGFQLTDEVRILICAATAQLTFGLDNYLLSSHNKIQVFPSTFYNPKNDNEYKGLTFQKNLIVLSWQDFEHGYLIHDDNYNLGLHELSHALRLSVNTSEFDSNFASYVSDWDYKARNEFDRMQKFPSGNFLRNYAAVNMSEFFSVCVEYFFEVPEKFKTNLPDIYRYLCILLNQDPLNTQNDYQFDSAMLSTYDLNPTEANDKRFSLNKEWPLYIDSIIVICFFAGLLFFWYFIPRMQINFGTFCMISAYSFFGMLVLTQLYRTIFSIRRTDSIDIMRMILLAPFFALITFCGNYITSGTITNEQYTIIAFEVHDLNRTTDKVEVILENDALNDFPRLRKFETDKNTYEWASVSYVFEKGIFGIKNLKSRSIILKNNEQISF